MRALKLIGLFIGVLLTLELVGYLLVGRDRINKVTIDNCETALYDFPDSLSKNKSLWTDRKLNENEKNDWRKFFKDDQIEFIHYDKDNLDEVKPTLNQFNYVIYTVNEFIILEMEESLNASEYVEVWQSRYIWLFYDWIKIEKRSTGQS